MYHSLMYIRPEKTKSISILYAIFDPDLGNVRQLCSEAYDGIL